MIFEDVLITYPKLDSIAIFLQENGAKNFTHGRSTLFEHLTGTASKLITWNGRPDIVYAGLCHSIYGTPYFKKRLIAIEQRSMVRKILGIHAEALVWRYSHVREHNGLREAFEKYLKDPTDILYINKYPELLQLLLANKVDHHEHIQTPQ